MEVLSNPNALIPRGPLCALTAAPCSGTLAGAAIFGCRVQRGARPACSARRGRRRHGGGAPEGPPPGKEGPGLAKENRPPAGVPHDKASWPFHRGRSDARCPARSVDELPLKPGSACWWKVVKGLSLGNP